jgi:type I restriction enzyme, S subunit
VELRPGYKQTEVGNIPELWDVTPLRELIKDGPKNGYSGACGNNSSGTATLSLAATSSGRLILNAETIKFLTHRIPGDSQLFLEQGDVLVQRSNVLDLVGTAAVFDGPAKTFVYPDLMMRLRFKNLVTGVWFWRFANGRTGRSFFRRVAAGSTGSMPKVSGENLRNMPVPVPPLSEQRSISETLSDMSALIESLEQLLTKKRAIKQGALQELLTGQRRLVEFANGAGHKDSEVGRIPEDWTLHRVEDLAVITTGARNTQDRVAEGQYPFFVRSQTVEHIDSYSFDGEAVLTAGDGVGTGKVFHYINGRFDAHQRVYRISDFKNNVCGYFFYLYFSIHFFDRIMQMTAKSSVDSVRREMIAEMLIPLPPTKAEQVAIAAILSDMDAEIADIQAKVGKARQLMQGMMQELLTGRIRLVQPSAEVVPFPVKQSASAGTNANHNPQINEAVVLAVLAHHFGSEQFPLGRFRRTKLSYLLHRHTERQVAGFMKKAAGPYNPHTRYGGAEKIALKNGYVRTHKAAKGEGFIAADNIAQAEGYFESWYGLQVLDWLKQFRYKKNEELELLTTVDMAIEDLRREGKSATVSAVKQIIHDSPEWKAKLDRATFADSNITVAIESCRQLFPVEE